MIIGYGIDFPSSNTMQICGLFNASGFDYMTLGPVFAVEDADIVTRQIDELTEKYSLPVAPATIMDHFNRKLLPEVEPGNALFGMLLEAVREAQEILAEECDPSANTTTAKSFQKLLGILDNKNLVSAMREYEKQKA